MIGEVARLAVLISGHGSNLQAVIDACEGGTLPAQVVVVVSNRRAAYGLGRAKQHGIPTIYHPLKPYTEAGRPRAEYDADLARLLQPYEPDWIVLAGWMHLFTMAFLKPFSGRVVNLHPALPGAFPGIHVIEKALEAYQRGEIGATGCMVHLVPDEGVDCGPLIAVAEVPILPDDSLADLEERMHRAEHRLLVESLDRLIRDPSPVSR